MKFSLIFSFILFIFCKLSSSFKVEGKVFLPNDPKNNADTTVIVNSGQYKGFLKLDGSFTVHNVPKGSFVVEVVSPTYIFEPIRVDVSAHGNVRARKLNNLKPNAKSLVKYPLDLKPLGIAKFFQTREKFSIFDMLKNPMVLMMVMPLLMVVVLPKLMNSTDPEVKKEMEESMKMFQPGQNKLPDMSEVLSNWFGGEAPKKKAKAAKAIKRK